MAIDDDSSDLSSVESMPSEPESGRKAEPAAAAAAAKKGIPKYFPRVKIKPESGRAEISATSRKRAASAEHEYVLADNPDIAFIVMFRNRFSDCFPKSLPHFGPQELERDVVQPSPGEQAEQFLCALLGLLLNRKQDVKPGHYNRALEDAINTHRAQWVRVWEDKSPLAGGATFATMSPTQRLTLLRALVLWSLASSETIKTYISQKYKQSRHEDDLNQPLSVQPWGSDSEKRRYFLVEGQADTAFRVYRESNPAGFNRTWRTVAADLDELRALAGTLDRDGGLKDKRLSQKMLSAVPRFEATEEKRKRREYRQTRKAQLKRPEPGFSLYEGRTRGKRIKYTFSDDDDDDEERGGDTDSTTARRSTRNTGTHTPAEPAGPVTTMSGRQIRPPTRMTAAAAAAAVALATSRGRETRSTTASVQGDNADDGADLSMGLSATGRPRRAAAAAAATRSSTIGSRARATRSSSSRSDDEWEEDGKDDYNKGEPDDDFGEEAEEEEEEEEEEVVEEEEEEEAEDEGRDTDTDKHMAGVSGPAEDEEDDQDQIMIDGRKDDDAADAADDDDEDRVRLDKGAPRPKKSLIVKLSIKKRQPGQAGGDTDDDEDSVDTQDGSSLGQPLTPPSDNGSSKSKMKKKTKKKSSNQEEKVRPAAEMAEQEPPSGKMPTSLAFRGSPGKAQAGVAEGV